MTWPLDRHRHQDQRLPHQPFTDSQTRSPPLLLHHCVPVCSYNTIIKLDTTIIKLITRNESAMQRRARVGRVQTSWGFHIRGPLLVGQHHCNFQKKVQQWAIRTAQKRTDCSFLEESAISRYLSRNTKIVQDLAGVIGQDSHVQI